LSDITSSERFAEYKCVLCGAIHKFKDNTQCVVYRTAVCPTCKVSAGFNRMDKVDEARESVDEKGFADTAWPEWASDACIQKLRMAWVRSGGTVKDTSNRIDFKLNGIPVKGYDALWISSTKCWVSADVSKHQLEKIRTIARVAITPDAAPQKSFVEVIRGL